MEQKKYNNNNGVTLDDLAGMIKTGFDEAGKELKDFRVEVDERFEQVDKRFEQVDKRFEQVDKRFYRIQNLTVTDHRHRLEYLELEVQRIKDMFAFK